MSDPLRSTTPAKPPSQAHLELREELLIIIRSAKDESNDNWEVSALENIIETCRKSFARELGERFALKLLDGDLSA